MLERSLHNRLTECPANTIIINFYIKVWCTLKKINKFANNENN